MTKKIFLFAGCLLIFSGCFETEFNFKTVVQPNGTILRETKIDGRGADRFAPPAGAGWEVKTYETRGGQSILEDKYYHIYASGRFRKGSQIGSDYQFNGAKQFEDISDEERKNFIELGLVEPFEENIYSKNQVEVSKKRGFFKSTVEYREVFQNRGIIELLLRDLKKEVIRSSDVTLSGAAPSGTPEAPAAAEDAALPPSNVTSEATSPAVQLANPEVPAGGEAAGAPVPAVTIEGQLLAPQRVEMLAKEKLTKEILAQFKFHSEVTLPGKIFSTNAMRSVGNTAVWDFTAADFQNDLSQYTLEVKSEMVEWKFLVVIICAVALVLFGVGSAVVKRPKPKTGRGRS